MTNDYQKMFFSDPAQILEDCLKNYATFFAFFWTYVFSFTPELKTLTVAFITVVVLPSIATYIRVRIERRAATKKNKAE